MKFLKLLARSAFVALLATAAHAQSTVGTIYGSVADPGGAKVTGAAVVITDVKTKVKQSNKTNGQGNYQFVAVNPSDYSVTVTAPGFKTETQTGVTVNANTNVNVSFTLTLGEADEKVEVSAGTTMVDTREAQIGETIDQARIEELPTINRDPYQLLQTVTGVSSFTPDILIGSRQGANFSVNGFPSATSSFYLDGAQNNILRAGGGNKPPDIDALQEFRILTSNFDAEFGRSPGAVVNLITKSGTDAYHGDLYEFLQNNLFNAKPYFSFSTPGFINNLKQHQFGGTVGGPIRKLHQTFFFVDYAHVQLHTDDYIYPSQWQLPTPAEASGDFTNDPLVTTGPKAATQIAAVEAKSCNGATLVICPTKIDPVAANVIKFVPTANPLTGASVTEQAPADNLVNQGLIRIDYNAIPHHSLEGTLFDSRGSALDPTAGGNQVFAYASAYLNNNTVNGIIADNWILSNNAVNSIRGFYSGNRSVISNVYPNHLLADVGASIPEAGPAYLSAPPLFQLGSDIIQIGPSNYGPSDVNQQAFGLVDVATLTYGKHSIKLGGSYIWDKYAELGTGYSGGYFNINTDILGGGDRYVDFLLGYSDTYRQSTATNIHRHNYDPALFVQDNWHILQRLSLNLGLRWEVFSPFYGDGISGTFRAGVQSTKFPTAPVGILYEGDRGVAPGIANAPYTDFAPRLGFAWDVYGDGRTSLRGGYGIFFYQQVVYDENRNQMPYGADVTLNPPVENYENPFPGPSPFPYKVSTTNPVYVPGGTVYATPSNGGSSPYAEEYNLSMQQQLTKTYALTVSYVGSGFIKQLQSVDINTPTLPTAAQLNSSGGAPPPLNRRPYEPYTISGSGYPYSTGGFYFQDIQELRNSLNSNYNSLQVTLRGRLGRQINLNSSYVWAKAMDNASPSYALLPRSSYGPSNVDIRNRFVLSGLFALPQTKRFGEFGRQVLDGWRLNAITYIQSGAPFDVYSDTDENHDGTSDDRPNIVANPYTQGNTTTAQKIHQYLNPAAFQSISAATAKALAPSLSAFFGNEQRNSLRLPYTTNTNLSIFKEFALPHATRLQFRVEAFNALNNVNLTSPRADLSTLAAAANQAMPSFAQLQSAQNMRQFQLGARLIF